MIIIQQIRVAWTAISRGAPGAVLRNAVPISTMVDLEECIFLFERYIFKEWDEFKQEREAHIAIHSIPHQVGNLFLKYKSDELDIGFRWEYRIGELFYTKKMLREYRSGKKHVEKIMKGDRLSWGVGYPVRHEINSAFELCLGMYGRLIINGRRLKRGCATQYAQDIYNIAVVDQPTPELFIFREPDRIIDLRVHLF